MKSKYDSNPYYDLYMSLDKQVHHIVTGSPDMSCFYKPLEEIALRILQNNGCRFTDNPKQRLAKTETLVGGIYIMYVKGGIGNDINEYFDMISFGGAYYLVVFIDYFAGMNTKLPDENEGSTDPSDILSSQMGNSRYYDAIKKIVDIASLFIEFPSVATASMLSTAAAGCRKWNPAIIAIFIINGICPIRQEDVEDMPLDDVKTLLNSPIQLLLYGIRI